MLSLAMTLTGCCSNSQAKIKNHYPANRVARPTRKQVRDMTRVELIGSLGEAHNYIDSLERDGEFTDGSEENDEGG